MPSRFFNRFRRITYSTSYLPEVDGLRFLAIFSVVLILHITHYIDEKFYNNRLIQNDYWNQFVFEGGNGVPLFFIISGFILSLPFARWRLNGDDRVLLKKYYLRRLTRLEPPFVIALLLFFAGHVWVLGKYEFDELLPHFFASAFYLHNAIYHNFSTVLPVSWSLEVEVQFYLLAPFFCLVFLIRRVLVRRLVLLAVILFSALYWFDVWAKIHVLVYLHYFFLGLLLADLHCSKFTLIKNEKPALLAGFLSLAGFLFIPSIGFLPGYLAKLLCMFVLFHVVLTNAPMKRIFSLQPLVIIGGMCYSIYLLHYGVVSAMGYAAAKIGISPGTMPLVFWFLAFVLLVLLASAFYFLLVEKPFMRPMGLGRPKQARRKQTA